MATNDILQWCAVAIAIIISLGWVIMRIKRKSSGKEDWDCEDDCCGCPLSGKCRKISRKE